MKRPIILALTIVLSGTVLFACGRKDPSSDTSSTTEGSSSVAAFEAQHKTEKETVHVKTGLIPQVIDKNVTYVQKEKDGDWEVESFEVENWGWEEDFAIGNTVWYMESDDARKLYSELDDNYSGKKASIYLHFKDDLEDCQVTVGKDTDGTPKMILTLKLTANVIFECDGEKLYLADVKVLGSEVYEDGTAKVKVDYGEGEGTIFVPADVKAKTWEDFCAAVPTLEETILAESVTYIKDITFSDLPSFTVTSNDVKDGHWDPKITNTKYGDNLSPDLTWDKVEGAKSYVLFMIDGDWLHMDVFTTDTSLGKGAIKRAGRGARYVGPYPPWGTHTYSVFVFALKEDMGKVSYSFDAGGNDINKMYAELDIDPNGNSGNVIAYGRLDGNYRHQD